jgi:lipopolysaccharide/colanic/teichoic acid biosynthesis glycosyltransferase
MYPKLIKRLIDVTLAVVMLVLLAPLLLFIAILVKCTSKGPVFFISRRIGQKALPFNLLKFRSMKSDARPVLTTSNQTIVLDGDPRLTPIGPWLRLGFDELPQLVNVVRGEMSLVGPRPDEFWLLEHYGDHALHRLTVRPGITGLAAICDSRRHSLQERYGLDNYYVQNLSLVLDLQIVLLTPLYILGFRGFISHRYSQFAPSAKEDPPAHE